MQPTCNNLCATLAQDAFVLIEWHDDMEKKWGESHFEARAGKGDLRCGDFIGVQKMPTKKQAGSASPSKHRCIAI